MAVSVNTGDGSLNVQIVMGRLYVKQMDHCIIQDVEHMGTEDWIVSLPTASPIYAQMIRGH